MYFWALTWGVVGMFLTARGLAHQDAVGGELYHLSIPAGSLGAALNSLAEQTGLQVIAASHLVETIDGKQVKGTFSVRDALQLLLADTGLQFTFVNPRTVTIHASKERDKLSKDKRLLSRLASGLFISGAMAGGVFAQDATADSEAVLEEVVVTGSRISYPGFVSPTPVASVTQEQLAVAQPKLFDTLASMPEFKGSTSNRGAVGMAGGTGGGNLSLRNFGAARTLVLLDGMRLPVSDQAGRVDATLIPDQLVSRVDVITGGASAAYGSDAVAGAVNFILDTRFEGLKADVAGGTSTFGDGTSRKADLSYGTPFAEGRGHVIGSFSWYRQDGISPENTNRDWYTSGATNISSPAGVLPRLVTYPGGARYLATPAGVITTGPLAGTTFGPGSEPIAYTFGSPRDTTYQIGGDGGVFSSPSLLGRQQRINAFAHAEFDLTENATLFLQGATARTTHTGSIQSAYTITGNAVTIFNDNAYLTQAMRNRMQAAGVTNFRLERIFTDQPLEYGEATGKISRARAGLRGRFTDDWTYNASLQFSRSGARSGYLHTMQWERLFAATDAVVNPATGQIVCRSTLQGLTPGCVPINLMGPGSVTPEAFEYIAGYDQFRDLVIDEVNLTLSSQRPVFRLWSDESAILAAGFEYKSQDAEQTTDGLSGILPSYTGIRGVPPGRIGASGWDAGGFIPFTGKATATEGFAELNVPIIDNALLARRLSMNTAVRYTKYDPSGPATTYKVGLVYEPIEAIRLRASYSRDMRAPSLTNMFQARTASANLTVITPFGNIPQAAFTLGNPDLEPERAKAHTVGVVFQPTWLRGFGASVDYYKINLTGGIGSPGTAQQIVDACYIDNSAFACSLITLASDRASMIILFPVINNTELETQGVDFQVRYSTPFRGGQFGVRAAASYTPTFKSSVPGAPVINTAGQVGNSKWVSQINASYLTGPATLSVTGRYISPSRINVTFTEGNQLSRNHVPSMTYLDAALLYDFTFREPTNRYQAYLQVTNVLNKDPPLAVSTGGSQVLYTNYNVYDTIGRFFTAGLRVRW